MFINHPIQRSTSIILVTTSYIRFSIIIVSEVKLLNKSHHSNKAATYFPHSLMAPVSVLRYINEYRNMELRKVLQLDLHNIASILESNEDWLKFVRLIPKNPESEVFKPKYSHEDIVNMQKNAIETGRLTAEVVFEEWGSSGEVRPTLNTLMDILQQALLFDAVNAVAHLLRVIPSPRPTTISNDLINNESMEQNLNSLGNSSNDGREYSSVMCNGTSGHDVNNRPDLTDLEQAQYYSDICLETESHASSSQRFSENASYSGNHNSNGVTLNRDLFKDILEDQQLTAFSYEVLDTLTNHFCETRKIGSGGFGDVYVGTLDGHGHVAVKRFQDSRHIKIFNTEVMSLSHLRHKNIVPIFGYSMDLRALCIVCKYIEGGSLLAKIAEKVLTAQQRMNIIMGTAEGLKYIHYREKLQGDEIMRETESLTVKKSYYLHGDVKSANILVTKDGVPKLCDFGLARLLDATRITKNLKGTGVYMAPEGFSGTITRKLDIFSFGTVLLELLTGLKPQISVGGEQINIRVYVKGCTDGDVTKILERRVSNWTAAQKIYDLAQFCIEDDKDKRPSIDVVWNVLNEINIEFNKGYETKS